MRQKAFKVYEDHWLHCRFSSFRSLSFLNSLRYLDGLFHRLLVATFSFIGFTVSSLFLVPHWNHIYARAMHLPINFELVSGQISQN